MAELYEPRRYSSSALPNISAAEPRVSAYSRSKNATTITPSAPPPINRSGESHTFFVGRASGLRCVASGAVPSGAGPSEVGPTGAAPKRSSSGAAGCGARDGAGAEAGAGNGSGPNKSSIGAGIGAGGDDGLPKSSGAISTVSDSAPGWSVFHRVPRGGRLICAGLIGTKSSAVLPSTGRSSEGAPSSGDGL